MTMYEPSKLFFYKSLFMAEILIAEFLFTFRLKRRSHYPFRFASAMITCMAFSVVVPIIGYHALGASILFVILFLFSVLALRFCYQEPWLHIFFCAVASYTVQHLAFELNNLIVVTTGLNAGLPIDIYSSEAAHFSGLLLILVYCDSYFIVYWLMALLFARRIHENDDLCIRSLSMFSLVALVVLVDVILNAMVTYYSYDIHNDFYVSIAAVSNIICCLLALYIQFTLLSRRHLEIELDTVNSLYEQEKKQYTLFKENVDYINIKCHDLRHQIRKIGRRSSLDEASIQELEDIISIYDSAIETGNETVDIILTEKSLLCNKNRIKLTCVVDGDKLSFMKASDIYSLFGNAIDNAMEALAKVEDEDKRLIGIIVKSSGAFLSIHFYNYCPRVPPIADGLPLTTKQDKQYHGFGMKSIQMITDRYSGDMSVSVENDVFNLRLLFPLE